MLVKVNGIVIHSTPTVDIQAISNDFLGRTVTNVLEQGAEYISQPINVDFAYGTYHLVSADMNPVSCGVKIVGHLHDLASHLF
jgi:hypothetical protein